MWPYSLKLVFLIELLETIVMSRSRSFKKQKTKNKQTNKKKPPTSCANFPAMTFEFHSSWCCVFSWRYLSNLIKTRLCEGWPVHMKTQCKDQGDTRDCTTLRKKEDVVPVRMSLPSPWQLGKAMSQITLSNP